MSSNFCGEIFLRNMSSESHRILYSCMRLSLKKNVIGIFDVASYMTSASPAAVGKTSESNFNYSTGCVIPWGINIAASTDKSPSSLPCLDQCDLSLVGSDTILFYYIFVPIKLNKSEYSPSVGPWRKGSHRVRPAELFLY